LAGGLKDQHEGITLFNRFILHPHKAGDPHVPRFYSQRHPERGGVVNLIADLFKQVNFGAGKEFSRKK
jgi:hypothetical protein